MPPAVILHLHIRPRAGDSVSGGSVSGGSASGGSASGGREALLDFLRGAKPFYESPGGIRMRLLESRNDPNELIEVFEYDTVEDYEADDERVRNDPEMKAMLAEWRALLDGPPRVEVWRALAV